MIGLAPPPQLRCHGCQREFPEDKWFARIRLGGQRVVFCSPYCTELFFALRTAERFESEWERDNALLAEALLEKATVTEPTISPTVMYGPLDLAQAVWTAAGRRVVTR